MACSSIFDAFPTKTENLADSIWKIASYNSVWLNLVPRDEYPRNSGLTQTNYTVGPLEPTSDEETWAAVDTVAEGPSSSNVCNTTFNEVTPGTTAQTYSPEKFGLKGPLLCKDELTFDHNVAGFLDVYLKKLAIRAQRSWEKRYEVLAMQFGRKFVAKNTFPEVDTQTNLVDLALDQATSEVTQEMLDTVAITLIQAGATNPDDSGFIGFSSDGPLFPLIIGMDASQRIAQNNANFRQDLNYADMGSGAGATLLKRIGANRVIKNFRHIPALFPPRYTYNAGTGKYVRVNTFESTATTKGNKYTVTAAYKAAPYEAAIIPNPLQFRSRVVRPTNAVSSLNWKPSNYMGEWTWVTGGFRMDTDCVDPLEKYGRHYAEFIHAPEPIFGDFGATIIFKRCTGALTTVLCS